MCVVSSATNSFALIMPHVLSAYMAVLWHHAAIADIVLAISFVAQYADRAGEHSRGFALGVAAAALIGNICVATMASRDRELEVRSQWRKEQQAESAALKRPPTLHQLGNARSPTFRREESMMSPQLLDMLNFSPNFHMVLDANGFIRWASSSAAEVVGKTSHDLLAKKYENFIVPEDAVRVVCVCVCVFSCSRMSVFFSLLRAFRTSGVGRGPTAAPHVLTRVCGCGCVVVWLCGCGCPPGSVQTPSWRSPEGA